MNNISIKDAATINPSFNKAEFSPETLVSFVPMAAVSENTCSIKFEEEGLLSKYSKGYTYFQKGDLLLAKITPCFENGKIAFASINHKIGFGSTEFIVIRINNDLILPRYLFYILRSKKFRFLGKNNMTGSAGQKRLRKDFLEDYPILLRSIADQKKIITILDQIEHINQKRKSAIELMDEYVRSIFLDIFGDPIINPKRWNKESLKHFGEVITGNTPPRNNKDNYSSKFIEWIKTDNIVSNKINLTTATEYLSEKGSKKARVVNPGALMVACIAGSIDSIGRAAIADRQVSFNQQINAIQPSDKVNSIFLYWLFKISKLYIQGHSSRGMKKIITKGEFEKIIMILPPLELQNRFAEIALNSEGIKQKMLTQSEELELQLQSLMQKSFSPSLNSSDENKYEKSFSV